MIYLGLDTETTGLPNAKLYAKDPNQARVVQLAMKLVNDEQRILAQFCTLIKPSGWLEIHPKAQETHGISREDCELYGVSAHSAFRLYQSWASMADMIVCHNAPFDKKMMGIEADALGADMPSIEWHCTMKDATPLCKIPPTQAMRAAGFGPYKNANLGEAMQIICGKELEGAHDAMCDVNGCLDLFFAIKQRKAA